MPTTPDRPLVDVALVAAGGALGSLGRWALTVLPAPWATLAANVTGCFLLGLLAGWLVHHPALRRFVGIGVLGGYTTFSAHVLDARDLLGDQAFTAAAYVIGTLLVCVAGAAAGLRLAHRLERHR